MKHPAIIRYPDNSFELGFVENGRAVGVRNRHGFDTYLVAYVDERDNLIEREVTA